MAIVGQGITAYPQPDDALNENSKNPVQNKVVAKEVGDLKSAVNDPVTGLDTKAPIIINSASGDIASFTDGADGLPIKQLTVNVEPIQAGSGEPSPDNVRPISGRTSATVTRTGRNILNSSIVHGIWTAAGWYDHENFNTKYLSTRYAVPVVGGKTYCFSLKNDSSNPAASGSFIAFANGNTISETATWFSIANGIINVPSGADSIAINIILTNNFASISDVSATDFQLELGSTATAYEPYHGNTYAIQLGDTVYGGTLDVTGGKMVVDRMFVLKSTTSGWVRGSAQGYYFEQSDLPTPDGTNHTDILCNKLKPSINEFGSVYRNATYKTINIRTVNGYNNVADMVADLGELEFVYPIGEPIEITLTPTQIETLLGTNNIWSDAGSVDVEYRADTKLYIDNIHTPTDNDMTADAQIASGKYFLIGGTLYKSTTTIPAGDTIRPGTNCIKTNLAEALNALNA